MRGLKGAAWYALIVLFAINALNFFDRNILGAIGEPVRKELELNDASLGLLQTAFTLFYAVVGIPFGWLADKFDRRRILSAGVFVWSLVTATSGFARNFGQLFALRLAVGVGEATCAPAATSLIGDLFPSKWRARAMSIFMLGLPIGIALSYAISGTITKAYGWRAAFFVAGLPGVLLAVAILFAREPLRGQSEKDGIGKQVRPGIPFWRILSSPTMILIIVSGAILNFNLYAISAFVTPYLMRYHNADIQTANYITTAAFGLMGAPGLLLGGYVGDLAFRHRINGRLLVPTIAIVLSIPLLFVGLGAPHGCVLTFAVAMGLAFALMYFYYSCVYSSIHDIFEPGLRGTAMAVYFMAFYVLGGSLGPYVTGLLSDYFTNRAARLEGVSEFTQSALEPFKADGLHSAMYMIPVLSVVLALVLYAATRTVGREIEALQGWMNKATKQEL
jgi:MFS family permease